MIRLLAYASAVNAMQMSCGHNKCAMTQELRTICEGVQEWFESLVRYISQKKHQDYSMLEKWRDSDGINPNRTGLLL